MTFPLRFQISVECTLLLFALSAGPGAFQVWLKGAEMAGAYWMVVGVPGCAAAAFLLLCIVVPGLTGDGLRLPRQITLPFVFTALLPTCASMWLTTPQELVSSFEVTRFAQVWLQPGELLICLGAQSLGMVILAVLRGLQ